MGKHRLTEHGLTKGYAVKAAHELSVDPGFDAVRVAELEQPLTLFALAAGDCKTSETELESPLFAGDTHDHKHEHEGEHSEIHAHYRFDCAKANELKQLDLSELFKRFPATEKIQVQLIGPSGQQGAELTPAQPRLNF